MDPQLTSDGRPYPPIRYREIIKECYVITRHLNTSYTDLYNITPKERLTLAQFIEEEERAKQKLIEEAKNKNK